MKKFLPPLLFLIGVLLLFVGLYASFEVYISQKLQQTTRELSEAILHLQRGENPTKGYQTLLILKTPAGKSLVPSVGLLNPLDASLYVTSVSKGSDGTEVYVYLRRTTLGEYLQTLLEEWASAGIAFSGAVLMILAYFMSRGGSTTNEELVAKLKALRTTLSVNSVIPEETATETKSLLDDILKKMEGKR
ncbi:hypothetical protein Thal_0569 [Thermocrinis albus DSM 14484]|uniref:Uncharacterized protein n=1 Tax=Thermocrinis albus (strain DSM 14484 / JCM 11386 / HI 11/12) TaxID=638303 RepID=D3SPW6_THEAH|nr:hypothetical protein [Thermocrinis albus]ADC89203.1 hypothetical protein Thal_0569 [Thermocrinis albus DSM 14484]